MITYTGSAGAEWPPVRASLFQILTKRGGGMRRCVRKLPRHLSACLPVTFPPLPLLACSAYCFFPPLKAANVSEWVITGFVLEEEGGGGERVRGERSDTQPWFFPTLVALMRDESVIGDLSCFIQFSLLCDLILNPVFLLGWHMGILRSACAVPAGGGGGWRRLWAGWMLHS